MGDNSPFTKSSKMHRSPPSTPVPPTNAKDNAQPPSSRDQTNLDAASTPEIQNWMSNIEQCLNEICSISTEDAASVRQRRTKFFKRQSRVPPEERGVRKQASEPAPPAPTPALRKHESYPQYTGTSNRTRTIDHEIGSLLIRAVTYIDRQTNPGSSTSVEEAPATRASHTPAVRNGPPLSCNFCWNTVDECGRILRRKTQYHCPECQTNLCIVPCFHEYHEGPDATADSARAASAR